MATKNIGYVADLVGDAQVRGTDGVIRVLSIGDQISEGDILTTGVNTNIVLEFYDGQKLQLGENTELLLDESVFAGLGDYPDARADQLAELQSLIVEGIDLAELEAPAAGAVRDVGDGLHQASIYSRDGNEGVVDTRGTPIGFDSSAVNDEITAGADDPVVAAQSSTEDSTPVTPAAASPVASISVDNITTDDIVNDAEAGGNINVTGTVGGDASPGDSVNLDINSTIYTGTVAAGDTFTISVSGADLMADTNFDATVTGIDASGNPFTATTTSIHTVDTSASATISVDNITADDIVNAVEAGGPINVIGTVAGDAAPGDTVSLDVNGNTYTGTVGAGNAFTIAVPGIDLSSDTTIDASVSGNDAAGNPFTATTTSTHGVDLVGVTASITLDANITPDDIISAAEEGTNVAITGTVGGDVADGDTVTLTVNGVDYTGAASGGAFSINVPGTALTADADSTIDASVTTTTGDVNGEATANASESYSVDTVGVTASITLDPNITPDDIISAAEEGTNIAITGTVGGDVADGDTVTLTVNGVDYTGGASGGAFSINVPGTALTADTDSTIEPGSVRNFVSIL